MFHNIGLRFVGNFGFKVHLPRGVEYSCLGIQLQELYAGRIQRACSGRGEILRTWNLADNMARCQDVRGWNIQGQIPLVSTSNCSVMAPKQTSTGAHRRALRLILMFLLVKSVRLNMRTALSSLAVAIAAPSLLHAKPTTPSVCPCK